MYAVSDLLKKLFSTKMGPEILAEIPRKLYVVHIELSLRTSKIHVHMYTFLNFTNIIDFLL